VANRLSIQKIQGELMNPETKLTQLRSTLNEYTDLTTAIALLRWDQETNMPTGGAQGRSHQLATLTRIAHKKFTSPEVGQLLEDLTPYANELDPDSDDARLILVTKRLYTRRSKVPASLMADIAKAGSKAQPVWVTSRRDSNFNAFRPYLEKLIDLRRQFAECFRPFDHIYDPLLDRYEPGLKTADVQAIFSDLRPKQVELLRAISQQPQVDDSFLHQTFAEDKQWDFGVEVITKYGFDWQRGRQDRSAHPFTQGFGFGDVRITTRFLQDYFPSAFFSTAHECGHALYAQGIDPHLARTPLDDGASLAVHESQSRLYENIIGRSMNFWMHFFPRLQEYFPNQIGAISLSDFYKAINKVEPSLIRVEADEATYNLHIMLRLELEIDLIEGAVEIKDLPEVWNDGMQRYLGVTPSNDSVGVLQDIHWSQGSIGYFSTYALGNLIAAQLWEQVQADISNLPEQIQHGEFDALTQWMREKIHRHGAKYEPQVLVQRITGSKIDSGPYLRYLMDKYTDIYEL
jgi:carboxypeptidase Taq